MKITIYNLICDIHNNGIHCESFSSAAQRDAKLAEYLTDHAKELMQGAAPLSKFYEIGQDILQLLTKPDLDQAILDWNTISPDDFYGREECEVEIELPRQPAGTVPAPAESDTRRRLNDIAHAVDERIPEGFGFFVLVFPFGGPENGRGNYTSNAQREDVIKVMKEFLIRSSATEDWMQHIK